MQKIDLGELRRKGEKPESALQTYFVDQIDPFLTWKDIRWLQSLTSLPVIVKGIMTTEDALDALKWGVSGIVVSNHGGRQLDSCSATVSC
jgi:4-hydroxymandelate oxidase